MAIHHLAQGQVTRPRARISETHRLPAPLQGMDSRVALTLESPYHCTLTANLMPAEYGMEVRKGYREWQTGLDDTAGASVRTIIPYEGVPNDGTDDRIFAVTNEGIWDVTVADGSPVLELSFSDDTLDAGYGVHITYVNDAGDPYVFYADQRNGLFLYTPSTDTWAQAPGITGVAATDIVGIEQHKERIWLFERDSTTARYLPVGAISGPTTEFFFAGLFSHGGSIAGIFNWSIDGGAGVDDFFVVASRGGDVLVYQGEDPSSATTWALRGAYYVGALPSGPFFGAERAGELYLLTSQGLVSMSDLLRGVSATENTTDAIGDKIAYLLRRYLSAFGALNGWQVQYVPANGSLVIKLPLVSGRPSLQLVYNFAAQGWGLWYGLPMTAFSLWKNNVIFGDADLRVLYMDRTRDNVALNAPPNEPQGDPVEFFILTSFSSYGKPGRFKRVQVVRPDFMALAPPTVKIDVKYDYDISDPSNPLVPVTQEYAIWDLDLFDFGLWAPGRESGRSRLGGASGIGRYVAIGMRGYCYESTRFVGWDVTFDTGGVLA